MDPREEIRQRLDLADLVGAYVRLERRGSRFLGLCPFHEEKTPSFSVNPDKGIWHCFGCGEGGDAFSFLMRIESLSFGDALRRLADKTGVRLLERNFNPQAASEREEILQALTSTARYFQQCLSSSKSTQAYLEKRRIDPEAVQTFGIGFAPEGWENLVHFLASEKIPVEAAVKAGLLGRRSDGSFYDKFRNRLMFPVCDAAGRVIAFGGRDLGEEGPKYLNSPETPVFKKSNVLYGFHLARKAIGEKGFAVLVEGYLDVVSAHRAGLTNTVAALGTAFGEGHCTLLQRVCDRVVVCLDADSAGRNAATAALAALEEKGLESRVAVLPSGEDPDSLVASGKSAALIDAIGKAVPGAEYRLALLFEEVDTKDAAALARQLERAVPIIASVKSQFERDRLIRKLVLFHPDYAASGGARDKAEGRIRAAIEGEIKRQSGAAPRRRPARVAANLAPGPEKSGKLSAAQRAERLLLYCLLSEDPAAAGLQASLSPELFAHEESRSLFLEICSRISDGRALASLPTEREGELRDAARLAGELLVSTYPPINEEVLEDCIATLVLASKRQEYNELQAKFSKGTLKTDEERERFQQLARELASSRRA